MPRSLSSLAAFSMAGMSDLEPMTMPTRGESTSSSSSSVSTSVSVVGSLIEAPHDARNPRLVGRGRLPGSSCGDVSAVGLAGEGDLAGGSICGGAGGFAVGTERGHVQDATTGGQDGAVALGRAGVGDLCAGFVEP